MTDHKQKDYYKVWRLRALALYEDKCARCGITDERVLDFDHIIAYSTDKNQERNSYNIHRGLVDGEIPKSEYQVLCRNCNHIKRLENNENRGPAMDGDLPRKITRIMDADTFKMLAERAKKYKG
jgi:hypothetical protein